MDSAILVQNIKDRCRAKGIYPTVACAESGAGKSLISQIEKRGIIPSVEKIQMLATYLGCTVSELLGEAPPGQQERLAPDASYSPEAQRFAAAFDAASEKDKAIIRAVLGI